MRGVSSRESDESRDEWRARVVAALQAGAPLQAYDLATTALGHFPADVPLRQLLMSALVRSGAPREAQRLAAGLVSEGHADEETLGLLARTYKDLAASTDDAREARRHLDLALECYQRAFDGSRGAWSGINVATLARLLDRQDEAERMARLVTQQCRDLLGRAAGAPDYWTLATLGEACLVLGEHDAAEDWYGRAVALGPSRLGDRVATRRNARLLLQHRGDDAARFDRIFQVPGVVACVGHLIDRPGRREPRFPPELATEVGRAIAARLDAVGAGIGFASAACGADLLALEALIARGAATHVVLPYERVEFARDSVHVAAGASWAERFDRAMAAATEVIEASGHRVGDGAASFEYAFRLLDGSAAMRADELETDLTGVAVWDGRDGDGRGGTAWAVSEWRRLGRRVEVIDLAAMRAATPLASVGVRPEVVDATAVAAARLGSAAVAPGGVAPPAYEPRVVALLFADVVGFSQLTDAELPTFLASYLGLVAGELAKVQPPPLQTNTWGDGVYVVFDDVEQAGRLALRLCEAVRSRSSGSDGTAALAVRIGLHAGLAYACPDPVTGRQTYIGTHVSRAARIEPVTPPGAVYASRPFAALARAEGVTSFACDYVGQLALAKGYGTFPTYVVRDTGA